MGIQETPKLPHWNYFLALEEDVLRLSRYIEFTQDNYGVYSLELARILFAASSEVDVVAKQLCAQYEGGKGAGSIARYREVLNAAIPMLAATHVTVPRFGLTFIPWEQWAHDAKPFWWDAYNNVKHHRHTRFADASLKNALNSIAALFVLLIYFYREECVAGALAPNPSLFQPGAPFRIDYTFWGEKRPLYLLD
jgi:hypothetical protein